MKKGSKLPRVYNVQTLVNICPCSNHQRDPITVILSRFEEIVEGSNRLTRQRLFFGQCTNCANVFIAKLEKNKMDGDYRILKVN